MATRIKVEKLTEEQAEQVGRVFDTVYQKMVDALYMALDKFDQEFQNLWNNLDKLTADVKKEE